MQNHLLQVFVLTAMEPPADASPAATQAAKLALLQQVDTLVLEESFLGQFGRGKLFQEQGYLDDDGVPDDSTCPTFAALVLRVDNDRAPPACSGRARRFRTPAFCLCFVCVSLTRPRDESLSLVTLATVTSASSRARDQDPRPQRQGGAAFLFS